MTDDKLREIVFFYDELKKTAELSSFLRNCSDFNLISGSHRKEIPSMLQEKIRHLVDEHFKELKEKQKEL